MSSQTKTTSDGAATRAPAADASSEAMTAGVDPGQRQVEAHQNGAHEISPARVTDDFRSNAVLRSRAPPRAEHQAASRRSHQQRHGGAEPWSSNGPYP